jgi:hypothetical protein
MTIHISFLIFRAYRFLFITQPIGSNTGRLPHTQKTANGIFGYVTERRKLRGRDMRVTFVPDWTAVLVAEGTSSLGGGHSTSVPYSQARKVKAHHKHRHL